MAGCGERVCSALRLRGVPFPDLLQLPDPNLDADVRRAGSERGQNRGPKKSSGRYIAHHSGNTSEVPIHRIHVPPGSAGALGAGLSRPRGGCGPATCWRDTSPAALACRWRLAARDLVRALEGGR